MMGADAEIEALRAAVSRHFTVSQITVNPFAVAFHVIVDPNRLDASFDALRRDLVPRNYVPTIVAEPTGTVIHVQKTPERKFRGTHVNLLLLVATIGTTWVAGAVNWELYADVPWYTLDALVLGFVSFTVPLLLILGAHEMGHYLVAKRHAVRASFPFFIPSIPILGTFGAFISMRDPIPNRKALLEIGLAGPLIGFALAVPITVLGLFLGTQDVRPPALNGGGEITMPSLMYGWIQSFFPATMIDPFRRHPTAFAGWVGLFVTAINLLPAGQLDGGHVARALFGENHRWLSYGAVLLLLVLGLSFPSWFLFALIIMLLGTRHPPPLNDITRLAPSRKALGALAIAILVVTFVPTPFVEVPTEASFAFEAATAPHVVLTELNQTIAVGASATISLNLNNTGNVIETVQVRIVPENLDRFGWTLTIPDFTLYPASGGSVLVPVDNRTTAIPLNVTDYATIRVQVGVPAAASPGVYNFAVEGRIVDPARPRQPFVIQVPVRITVP